MTSEPRGGFEVDEISDCDVETVVSLWRSSGLVRPWNDPYQDIHNARSTPTATILVVRPGARGDTDALRTPVGSVMAGFDGHRGWLYYLAVDEPARGAGLGRMLVVAAEAWLAAQGAEKAQLMVREANAAVQGFYTALGYSDAECVVLGRRLA
ncbi:GNAT family acetyltransferase [Sanguibacter antarcticus]|uniref:Ribosomal protein S18 acetylase RimI-like enzyme n=1 Tax=Sanguibacter antarcticus TaxID=372484 RepID=A0A2A9E5M6_9MICO|nr:GNAT family acetyltransferase [Sanguibacter antarcticus]PFG33956.1 ribosomal protein S18 acetylase RimI-like enzyme [Sanguibacter antarcticus]